MLAAGDGVADDLRHGLEHLVVLPAITTFARNRWTAAQDDLKGPFLWQRQNTGVNQAQQCCLDGPGTTSWSALTKC